jgi:hypothetical protein
MKADMAIAQLAFLPTEVMALMIPLVALMIPIVVTLTKHQQRMAEILHRPGDANEVEALRREVAELKSLVHQQAFALDRLSTPIIAAEVDRLKI